MTLLLIFAFISGLVTIAAPCIWPLLPLVLSTSTTGGHRKPLGLTIGILVSFGVITLVISYIAKIFPIDLNALRLLAAILIALLGLTLLIPQFSAILEGYISRFSGRLNTKNNKNGFWGGILTGISIGIVWTPCAGPILATIAALSITTSVNFGIILVTLAYLVGIGIPLFIFSLLGRRIFTQTRSFSKYTPVIQKIFGTIMILTALAIYTNYDKVLEAKLLNAIPSYSNFITRLETNQNVTNQLNALKNKSNKANFIDDQSLFNANYKAPEFTGITRWLNTQTIPTIENLKGKVILVDFWTYTCINCIRSLPHVTGWYDKYKDQGFVVIGIHTPEFEFEKNQQNVEDAIKRFNIHYPVLQDNDYKTWDAFKNQYWPAEYLIDAKGQVRRAHFGEGEYDQTEKAIVTLLKEAGRKVNTPSSGAADQTPTAQISPETYLGAERMQFYYKDGNVGAQTSDFKLQDGISPNTFDLGGNWTIARDKAVPNKNGVLEYNFLAARVFLVLKPGSATNPKVKVFLDGKIISKDLAGTDVKDGYVTIDTDRLYNLVDLKEDAQNHLLRLEFDNKIEVFAFTFG